VQDHAGGIDERQQRVTQRLAELTFDGGRTGRRAQDPAIFVQLGAGDLTISDFLAKAREHDADAFGDGGMTLAFDQRLHVGLAEKFVRRRQFLKQRGFVGGGH
jgi:hypothetical protein